MPPIVSADNIALGGADVSELLPRRFTAKHMARECEALYGERR
jgi:hypothetical protein